MAETKLLEKRREVPLSLGGLTWPAWPSRRWLDEFFRDSGWNQMIRIEEFTEPGFMVVRAELPGVDPEKDVEVEVVEDMLMISAQKAEKQESVEGHLHRSEFRYGSLTRSVPLPKGIDESKIVATYKDGVLEVRLPMPAGTSSGGTHRVEVTRA